jgi:hypothetical protein
MRKNPKNRIGRYLKNRTEFPQQPAHEAEGSHGDADIRGSDPLRFGALTQIGSAPEQLPRRQGDAMAKATAKQLDKTWKSEPRGAGRLLSIDTRFVFGHDGNPDQDGPAKRHLAILDQVFGEVGIHATGFGVHERTWCLLIDCPEAVDDRQLEKLVNAAWILAVGQSNRPLKKAVARVKRQLDGDSQANLPAGKIVDQDAAKLSEHRTPRVATALGQSKLRRRLKERRRARGRKLVRTGLC